MKLESAYLALVVDNIIERAVGDATACYRAGAGLSPLKNTGDKHIPALLLRTGDTLETSDSPPNERLCWKCGTSEDRLAECTGHRAERIQERRQEIDRDEDEPDWSEI